MSLFLPLLLGGGAAAVVVAKGTAPQDQKEISTQAAIEGKPTIGNGSLPGATVTQLANKSFFQSRIAIAAGVPEVKSVQWSDTQADRQNLIGLAAQQSYSSTVDPDIQEKLDIINTYGQAAYDSMSAEAKTAAAKALSDALKLDPPMTGDEDWSTIAKIAGGAAGAAAFSWLPGGVVWGPIVGAYFGVKLEELLSKKGDEIKAWFKSRWADIESKVAAYVEAPYTGAKDVYNYLGSIF